ncbi:hypothetical protein B0A48_12999 [Cryoendolithus antarcticus]|uniref:Uncharacterized protein n=1 Tax=Cryoendolithus antarcticus TaxID=1507870 RepID=A0A1V8SQZ4_9PEZI|nr:hypothetical protein B0A48_12999 [Cryoendolithus antarcticus]
MTRRSSARATPRKHYTVDAFEGISELQDAEPALSPPARNNDSDSADDFIAEEVVDDANGSVVEAEDDDAMSGVEDEDEILHDVGSDVGEQELDDSISIVSDYGDASVMAADGKAPLRTKGGHKRINDPGNSSFNRGLPDHNHRSVKKQLTIELLFGRDPDDWARVKVACDKWDQEGPLPGLREPDANGKGGFHNSYWQGVEERQRELDEGWKWYLQQGGREQLQDRQAFTEINLKEATVYDLVRDAPDRAFLMGPVNKPNLNKLATHLSVSLDDGWTAISDHSQDSKPRRSGFVLNLGARVRCLEWAPNQDDDHQYLATSTLPEIQVGASNGASAYVPRPASPASIQIWQFATDNESRMRHDTAPLLSTVLCTDWGDAKALKWCPSSRKPIETKKTRSLGLLAGVWADGGLRVLDITVPRKSTTTTYLRIDSVAFTAHPPNTLFTALSWLSSTRLAASTANGCVAVFSIPSALSLYLDVPLRPELYTRIATGYILALTSCYPSHPSLILTSSTDGFPRLTDLSSLRPSSHEATVLAQRSRTTVDLIAWHDFSQAAITLDESLTPKALAIRRFFTSVNLGRGKAAGTALTTSPCHPSILWGTTKGDVIALNPMARIRRPKIKPVHQTWFSHEYRRATPAEISNPSNPIGVHGLSRFTDGYKVEDVVRDFHPRRAYEGEKGASGNPTVHTLYEEETAVTALSWNPNVKCGGWAAAGCGDGLVRVEDLVPG